MIHLQICYNILLRPVRRGSRTEMPIGERDCGVGEGRRLHYLTLVLALPLPLLWASVLSVILSWFTELLELICTKCISTLWYHTVVPCHSLLCHLSVYSFYCLGTCLVLRFPVLSYLDSPGTPIAVLGFCPVLMGMESWWRRDTGPLPGLLCLPA